MAPTNDDAIPTLSQIEAKWAEMAPLIDRIQQRCGSADEFPVESGSSLDGDDKKSDPYQVSHVVRMCLSAGVDHLHALKSLVVDLRILHVAAPASLARGSLENFSAAFWVLSPDARNDRIERALRWHAKNLKDGDKARENAGIQPNRPLDEKLRDLRSKATERGISANVAAGYTSTEAVRWAEQNIANLPLGTLLPWQLCSGFAHGRPWAYLGTSIVEKRDSSNPDVQFVKLESNQHTTLYPALAATQLLEELLRKYDQRAGSKLSGR